MSFQCLILLILVHNILQILSVWNFPIFEFEDMEDSFNIKEMVYFDVYASHLSQMVTYTQKKWTGQTTNKLWKSDYIVIQNTQFWGKTTGWFRENTYFTHFILYNWPFLPFKKQFSPISCHLTQCLGLKFPITQLLSFVGTSKTCKKPSLSSRYQWLGQN